MTVTLTADEMLAAAFAGVQRQVNALAKKSQHTGRTAPPLEVWGNHIEAAGSELAVSKATNRHWHLSLSGYSAPDVGTLHVRQTTKPDGGLIVRGVDPDEHYFVLVTGMMPVYEVVGYIMAAEVKVKEYYKTGYNGAKDYWLCPQSALTPIKGAADAKV